MMQQYSPSGKSPQLRYDESHADISSLDGHLSHALSIESLTQVPTQLHIAINKTSMKPPLLSSQLGHSPILRISNRNRVEGLQMSHRPEALIVASDRTTMVRSGSTRGEVFTNQDIKQNLAAFQYPTTLSHQELQVVSSQLLRQKTYANGCIQVNKIKQIGGHSFRDPNLQKSADVSPVDIDKKNVQSALTKKRQKHSPTKERSQNVTKVLDSAKRANRVQKLNELLAPGVDTNNNLSKRLMELQKQLDGGNQSGNASQSISQNTSVWQLNDQSNPLTGRKNTKVEKGLSSFKITNFDVMHTSSSRNTTSMNIHQSAKSKRSSTVWLDKIGAVDLYRERNQNRNRYASQQQQQQLPQVQESVSYQSMTGDDTDFNIFDTSQMSTDRTKLSVTQKAPRAEKMNLAAEQNLRLNEMRQLMQAKIADRRQDANNSRFSQMASLGGQVQSRHLSVRQSTDEILRKARQESMEAIPPFRQDQSKILQRISSSKSNFHMDYNAPLTLLRPTNRSELPVFEDHVGPCPPHQLNQPDRLERPAISLAESNSKKAGKSALKSSSLNLNFSKSKTGVNFERGTSSLDLGASLGASYGSNRALLLQSNTTSPKITPRKTGKSVPNGRRGVQKSKKVQSRYNEYGALIDAPQEQQVKAIIRHFQQRMIDGTWSINAGKPKPREIDPKIARNSTKLLVDTLDDHIEGLSQKILKKQESYSKRKSLIHLGSFNNDTIQLFQELDELKKIMNEARGKNQNSVLDATTSSGLGLNVVQTQPVVNSKEKQSQMSDIKHKIQRVLNEIAAQGPEDSKANEKFVSVQQIQKNECPEHLPDIHEEMTKFIEEEKVVVAKYRRQNLQTKMMLSESTDDILAVKQKKDSKFYQPHANAQVIVFPEQVRIENRRLQVLNYEMGAGLVDAISWKIRGTNSKQEAIEELTLDQNNLSDAQLADILEALYTQGNNFRQACSQINISGNEFGKLSTQALVKFFEFQSPENVSDLRLTNLNIQDSLMTQIFTGLEQNLYLIKFKLSGTNLNKNNSIGMLCTFLEHNDLLQELELSYTHLSIQQLTEIFQSLPGAHGLSNLSIAFNTIEHSRSPEQAQELFETMAQYFEKHQKLVHLDLSGCNIGHYCTLLGPSLAKSLTLQSIHLSQNFIGQDARIELFEQFRVRYGARQTQTEVKISNEDINHQYEESSDPIKLKGASIPFHQSQQLIQDEKMADKLATVRRQKAILEATQFQGVGRHPEVYDKLILIRRLGHQELNLFNKFNVSGWQVSPTDQCYICEGWKYTVFFYDRRQYMKNKLFDCVTRWIMELFNKHLRADHKRRVAPTITAPSLISHSGTLPMVNTLEYVARCNKSVCFLLEQAQVNAMQKELKIPHVLKFYLQNKVNVADNIALSMDLDVNDLIIKSMRYPDDTEVIGMPEQSSYFSREMEDDQTFIFAGFVKPGKHTVVISDPLILQGPIQQTFLVNVRAKDLHKTSAPQVETSEQIDQQGASRLDSSILFSNWKKDKQSLFDTCFNFDMENFTNFSQLATSEIEFEECQKIIQGSYQQFVKVYAILAAHSKSFPCVDKPRFEVLMNKINILSSHFQLSSCFKIFDRVGGGQDLNRPQFLMAILQVIYAKYLRPKAVKATQRLIKRMSSKLSRVSIPSDYMINDMSGGVKNFFEVLIPKFNMKRTWLEFRVIVQNQKTCKILIDDMTILRRVYSSWSEIVNNKRLFSLQHALKLFSLIKKVTTTHPLKRLLVITDKEISACWGLSKITVKDMNRDFDRTKHMVFVEFLEFMCRVAQIAQFVTKDAKRSMYSRKQVHSSGGEDADTYVAAQLSQNSDPEDRKDSLMYANDSDTSHDDDFVPSQELQTELANFSFLFHRNSLKRVGKGFRQQLRWLISLLNAVQRKQAKYQAAKQEEQEELFV